MLSTLVVGYKSPDLNEQTDSGFAVYQASFISSRIFLHHSLLWLDALLVLSGLTHGDVRELLDWRGQTTSSMCLAVDIKCKLWLPCFLITWLPIIQLSDNDLQGAFPDTGHRAAGSGTWMTLILPPHIFHVKASHKTIQYLKIRMEVALFDSGVCKEFVAVIIY